MKASKESSSRLCPLGDVPPSAARWGGSGVASRVSDPARVSSGPCCGAPPGVLASARSARFARGAAPAQSVAEGQWRPSSHWVSGVGPSGSVSGWSAANASPPLCAAMFGGSALCIDGQSACPPGSPIGVGVGVRCGGPRISSASTWVPRAAVGSAVQALRLDRSSVALPLGRGLPPRGAARVSFPDPRAVGCPPGRRCVPGPGRGPGRGLGDREMTALPAAPSAQLVGRGAAGAPVRPASWPVGLPRRTFPEPGGLGPRQGRGCGAARCRRAGRRWRRSAGLRVVCLRPSGGCSCGVVGARLSWPPHGHDRRTRTEDLASFSGRWYTPDISSSRWQSPSGHSCRSIGSPRRYTSPAPREKQH